MAHKTGTFAGKANQNPVVKPTTEKVGGDPPSTVKPTGIDPTKIVDIDDLKGFGGDPNGFV